MNNCLLDYKNNVQIPQNNIDFFKIFCDPKWKYSIQIKFDTSKEIDYLNLFLIIKSYLYNETCLTYAIGTCFEDLNSKRVITQKENMLKIKTMDYLYFCEWINHRIKKDGFYEKKDDFYGILILFEPNIVVLRNLENKIEILNILKPTYPWTLKWLDFLNKNVDEKALLQKKIESLENQIKPTFFTKKFFVFTNFLFLTITFIYFLW